MGWWESLSRAERAATGLPGAEPSWEVLELAFSSPARLAMVPLQDVLGLGTEARMNTPGRGDGNWRWRYRRGALTDDLAGRLRAATERSGRLAPGR